MSKNNPQSAKSSYDTALVMLDRIIEGPMTDEQAFNRSYLLERTGDAALAIGNGHEAANHFRAALEIVESLVANHPNLVKDRAVLQNKIAGIS